MEVLERVEAESLVLGSRRYIVQISFALGAVISLRPSTDYETVHKPHYQVHHSSSSVFLSTTVLKCEKTLFNQGSGSQERSAAIAYDTVPIGWIQRGGKDSRERFCAV